MIEGYVLERETENIWHPRGKDEHKDAQSDRGFFLCEQTFQMSEGGADRVHAQFERENANILCKVRCVSRKYGSGASEVFFGNLDLLEQVETGRRDQRVTNKGAIAKGLVIIMQVIKNVVEKLGWESCGPLIE